MKTKVILTMCVVFVWGLVSLAQAQVVAGSPEDKAFQKIDAENNLDAKITLLVGFEKEFPQSKGLKDAYIQLVDLYGRKKESPKVLEYSEKLLKVDPNNLLALLTATHAYAAETKPPNFDRAIQYGEKATEVIAQLKNSPPAAGYSDKDWKDYLDQSEVQAKQYVSYAKGMKR
jgi:tetratricopeptide (TPR) repeat protein